MAPVKPREGTRSVRSVERAIDILLAFSIQPEWNLAELSSHLGLHKSTIHRLVLALVKKGLLEKKGPSKYRLSLKLFELGCAAVEQIDLRHEARLFLQGLSEQFNETVHLVVRDGNEAIYIEKMEPQNAMVRYSRVGKRLPLHCTAVGKVLLSSLPRPDFDALMAGALLVKYTEHTISEPDVLWNHLLGVASCGYAVDNEELEYGLKCVAAPLRDHTGQVVAAISISSSPTRMPESRVPQVVSAIKETALSLSCKLGYKKPIR
ncbi:MAG: IclR family transcriptional regulator [Bacillota bacterium]